MSNRLKKVATLVYTPSSSYVVQAPAYYRTVTYYTPGHYAVRDAGGELSASTIGGSIGTKTYGYVITKDWVPPSATTYSILVQPVPQTIYTPASITFTGQTGWNAGASSLEPLFGDGHFTFQVKSFPSPMSVGIGYGDNSVLPSEPSHSLYFSGTSVVFQEFGVTRYTPPSFSHDYGIVYKIARTGTTVRVSATSGTTEVWAYTSSLPASGPVVLDTALFAAGDYVDNPVMVSIDPTGSASGSFAALTGFGFKTASGKYASAFGSFQPMQGTGLTTGKGTATGAIPTMIGVAADRPYCSGLGTLPLLTGTADGGYPRVTLLTGFGAFEAPIGFAIGLTGEVGSVSASFPAPAGLGGDYDYGDVQGSFAPMRGYGDQGAAVNVPGFSSDNLTDVFLVGDYFVCSDTFSTTLPSDALTVGDFLEAFDVVTGDVTDELVLSDSMTVQQAIEAIIQSTLTAGNNITSSVRVELPGGVIPGEPLQYAVNVLTGALTTYSGFGFDQYARAEQTLYGCRSDGVYRIRRGDDDGVPLQAHVDFGESVYGSTKIKTVESVYLGVTTDGSITARVSADGAERRYRVVPRGTLHRALTAKGVPGRTWGVSLEVVDATEFELDVLEVQVGITSGRWRSR